MVLPRASSMRSAFRSSTLRGSGPRVRSRFNQHLGRRTYASEHGSQKASSDIPWLIGSIAVTVPSATWLWQQGPKKGEGHGHGDHEEHAESEAHEEDDEEKSKDEGEEKPKDAGGDEEKDDGGDDDKEEDGGDKAKSKEKPKEKPKDKPKDKDAEADSEDSGSEGDDDKNTPPTSDDEDGEDKPSSDAPKQINKPSGGKGAGETSKGERAPTEKKGEKDSQGNQSGAKHPSLDDPEKSKKGEGITETAKIHGTVDTARDKR